MNRSGLKVLAAGSLALLAACGNDGGGGGGGGGGGSLFVQSCSLGCSSGQGGAQVSCAIVNTFQNQELSLLFSEPVAIGSVTTSSFRIVDVVTGQVPNGTFLLDPTNPRRVIFRPALIFTVGGAVEFGFDMGASYQVFLPGTAQGDPPPFVESTSGAENRSRLLCSITTDQGVADSVPGPPQVAAFVDVVDVGGAVLPDQPADGTVNVSLGTDITFTFNDLMDIGSLIQPGTGTSPSISVVVDGDGDPITTGDQVGVAGTYTFDVDLAQLTTTVVFHPSAGLPSAGTGTPKRKIIVTVPGSVVDISGKPISNPGTFIFEPQAIAFPPVSLAEDFQTTIAAEIDESGASMWSQLKPGGLAGRMLGKGVGGGSGRLGPLDVAASTTLTLDTSPIAASATLSFAANPCSGESFELDGQIFTFLTTPIGANDITRRANTELTVDQAVFQLSQLAFSQPLTFEAIGGDTIRVTANQAGSAGNAFQLVTPGNSLLSSVLNCAGGGTPALQWSGATLAGGGDGEVFAARTLLDNFDYQANPGGTPSDILVDDGVFEFSRITLGTGSRLVLRGTNPGRLFARGRVNVNTGAVIDVSGADGPAQVSTLPDGELGGAGGPNGGSGGKGGDRPDINDPSFTTISAPAVPAIQNPGASLDGEDGQGVGLQGTLAAGMGGIGWPTIPPQSTFDFGTWHGNIDFITTLCRTFNVSGPGSGGGYALDGGDGVAMVPIFIDSAQMNLAVPQPTDSAGASNTPGVTPGGNSGPLGIEPPGAPRDVRLLDPDAGDLRGGSGGGGAGGNIYGLEGFSFDFVTCALISSYPTHSGAAGGGAGGGVQVQAGETINLNGTVDAAGGLGGSGVPPAGVTPGTEAFSLAGYSVPGGGGSGGAVLVQANRINLSAALGNRVDVSGGVGGTGLQGALGGDGSPGLVRLEDTIGTLNAPAAAAVIAPILPNSSEEILSVGQSAFMLGTTLPGAFSGAQSCWFRPDGSFFSLTFDDDGPGSFGWDATLIVDFGGGPQEISYRDPAQNGGIGALGGQSPEQFWGTLLDRDLGGGQVGAPIVVRFQGAQSVNVSFAKVSPGDPYSVGCNVDDSVQSAQIQNLTPWVNHPAELNAFVPPPNMIRFVVIFDESHADADNVLGLTNVQIQALPN